MFDHRIIYGMILGLVLKKLAHSEQKYRNNLSENPLDCEGYVCKILQYVLKKCFKTL
jgi:hypothetical protein